jgi:hypothetical protein
LAGQLEANFSSAQSMEKQVHQALSASSSNGLKANAEALRSAPPDQLVV